ncbi:GNAT family N-acetyltransferase [Sporosarcina sp. CAU 1771]
MIEVDEFPVLETDRLILRQVTNDDAKNLLTYFSDTDVVKYYGLEPFKSIDEALDEISWYKSIFEKGTGIRWGISLKGSDKIIGSCGFFNKVVEHSRTEIGYELSKEYWGKGIAGEALESVVKYGFQNLQLERIEALLEPANLASLKLLDKMGFEREGLLRHYEFTCGKFDDLYIYSILKSEVVTT